MLYTVVGTGQIIFSGSGARLTPWEAATLYPCFGGLVYNARIHFGAPVEKAINKLFGVNRGAITFGEHIFIAQSESQVSTIPRSLQPNSYDANWLRLLTHELVHVWQYYQRGRSLPRMGGDYFAAYFDAGCSYEGISLEVAAYSFANTHAGPRFCTY